MTRTWQEIKLDLEEMTPEWRRKLLACHVCGYDGDPIKVSCHYEACTEFRCPVCLRIKGGSFGAVGCPSQDGDRGHGTPEEQPRLPVALKPAALRRRRKWRRTR